MPGKPLNETEIRLAKEWYLNEDMAPSEIASGLRRDKSSITRLIVDRFKKKMTASPSCQKPTHVL